MPTLFCFGLSYSAAALITQLRCLGAGWSFAGTCRDPQRAAAWAAEGVTVHPLTGGWAEITPAVLAEADHLLISVPPDGDGDPVARACQAAILARPRRWVGYLSTIGVYGDRQGGWIDEETPLVPRSDRAMRRVLAEQDWLRLHDAHGLPVHLFRLAGIYGPGRSLLDDIRAGTAQQIVKPGQYFNRIHVDDIAQTLAASITAPRAGRVYNVCDDEPAESATVFAEACALLGVPLPPAKRFEDAILSPMARQFWADNRRVRNTRLRQELGVSLLAPTYREGLRRLQMQE